MVMFPLFCQLISRLHNTASVSEIVFCTLEVQLEASVIEIIIQVAQGSLVHCSPMVDVTLANEVVSRQLQKGVTLPCY